MARPNLTAPVDWTARNRELSDSARRVAATEPAQGPSGDVVMLTGKTQQARDIIRRGGNPWAVLRRAEAVLFTGERGPWLLCESPQPVRREGPELAWVREQADADYAIVRTVDAGVAVQ